jgi:hypothetical protein
MAKFAVPDIRAVCGVGGCTKMYKRSPILKL